MADPVRLIPDPFGLRILNPHEGIANWRLRKIQLFTHCNNNNDGAVNLTKTTFDAEVLLAAPKRYLIKSAKCCLLLYQYIKY